MIKLVTLFTSQNRDNVSQVYDKDYTDKKAGWELKLNISVYKLQSSLLLKIIICRRRAATTIITCQTYI